MKRLLIFITCVSYAILCSSQDNGKLWTTNYDGSTFSQMETGFSHDSKYYAYGSNDGKIFIRDVLTAELFNVYHEHKNQVFCVTFHPNGSLIASGDKKGMLVGYDYTTKTKKFSIQAHEKAIATLSFSPDGSKIITGSGDNSIKIWDAVSGSKISEIRNIKGNVCFAKVSPDGKKLVVATKAMSNGIIIYDFATGTEIIKVPGELIEKADLSPDGRLLAVANLQKKISIWNLNTQALDRTLEGHERTACCVAYSPDGKFLASGGQDKEVIIWDEGRYRMKSFNTGSDWMENVVFSPNSEFLAVLNKGGDLSMYNVNKMFASKLAATSSSATPVPQQPTGDGKLSSALTVYALWQADTIYASALKDLLSYIEYSDDKYLGSAAANVAKALDHIDTAIEKGDYETIGMPYYIQAVKTLTELNEININYIDYKQLTEVMNKNQTLQDADKSQTIYCFVRSDIDGFSPYKLKCSGELKAIHEKLMNQFNANIDIIMATVTTLKTFLEE